MHYGAVATAVSLFLMAPILAAGAPDLGWPLHASLRGSEPIQTRGVLAITAAGAQQYAQAHLKLAPDAVATNETILAGDRVRVYISVAVDYGLPGGVSPPPIGGGAGSYPVEEAILTLFKLRPEAEVLGVLGPLSLYPDGALTGTDAACAVRHPIADEQVFFPTDPGARGVAWPPRNPEYDQLAGECSVGATILQTPDFFFVYGMDVWLLGERRDPELIRTGTFEEKDENGIPYTVSRVLIITPENTPDPSDSGVVPYHVELPYPARLKFFAHEFVNVGTVSVGPTVGNRTWGSSETKGDVQPFEATGTMTLAWSPESYIEIAGTTLNAPERMVARAPRGPVSLVWGIGLAAGAASAAALAWLLWLLFSKIAPDRVLEHPRRVEILNYVRAEPGVEANTVCRHLGLHWVAAQHHIRTLRRAGYVTLFRVGGRTALFPAKEGYRGRELRIALLRRKGFRRVLEAVRASPGLDQARLAAQLGLSRQGVSKVLAGLVRAGLVREDSGVRARRYFVHDAVDAAPTGA